MEKKRVINQQEELRRNMNSGVGFMEVLKNTPEGILSTEKIGQNEILKSCQLPVKMDDDDKKFLEKMGVKFFQVSPNDKLFYDVELPKGWKKGKGKEPHQYWTYLFTEKDEEVAMIFYKAVAYDRDANLSVYRKFKEKNN